jgi:superfamily I DNA/RNA helicase
MNTLNEAQRKAVEKVHGRLLILAGAGSGKTKVVTMRIAHLIQSAGVSPESILGLTFTNKAALEMQERLEGLIGKELSKKVMLSTFHSFCMFVLRKEAHHVGYTPKFSLYDRQDYVRLVTGIAREVLEHEGKDLPSLQKTIEAIGLAKNKGLKAHEIEGTGSKWHDEFCREVAKRLHEAMRAYNALDFDHMLLLTLELFELHPEALEKYQKRFRFVLIDEYQDTNPVQAKIAELLTKESKNLCVVGDDDQSIYSWRGADVANILQFQDAEVVKLEQNFRSTSTILQAANSVIHCNQKRHGKKLWSNKGAGDPIEVFFAPNEVQEAEAIVARLIKIKEHHLLAWSDFAILYRSNTLSRSLETALLRHTFIDEEKHYRRIPYAVYGGDEFYEHKEIKDILSYLRVMVNPADHEALLRIINYPRRGVGEAALSTLVDLHRKEGVPLWNVIQRVVQDEGIEIPDKAKQGLKSLYQEVGLARASFAQGRFQDALTTFLKRIDFEQALFEEVKSDSLRKNKLQNIQELGGALFEQELHGEGEPLDRLSNFLSMTLLDTDSGAYKRQKKQEDHVHLMTFHSSKGLEFPACFLVGLEDHLIPHERSIQGEDVEEERRLLYVAITRAQRFLTISMAASRKRLGRDTPTKPSRFLLDIPQELFRSSSWNAQSTFVMAS